MKLKLCTALLTAVTVFVPLSLFAGSTQDPAITKRTAMESYGRLPLSFEPTASPTRFLARSGDYAVSIGTSESAVMVSGAHPGERHTLRFAFENTSTAAQLEPSEKQSGVTNYCIGSDQSKWRMGVSNYAKLREANIYPGVDVVYYGDHRQLEFDFVIAPKADPSQIVLSFAGMDKLYKDALGSLVAEVGSKSVRFIKPYAYQKVDGTLQSVSADYEVADGKVRLRLGNYDRSRELIVDPVVSFVTYIGGAETDQVNGIAVDTNGNVYVVGFTYSTTFNGQSLGTGSAIDTFVTEYNPTGTTITYTTLIGGDDTPPATAVGNGIALDSTNRIYIIGTTNSPTLPVNLGYTLTNQHQSSTYQGGDTNAFIMILSNAGIPLRSTYLGSTASGAEVGKGIAVDASFNVIAVGQTCTGAFPTTFPGYNAFEPQIQGCVAFITKMDNLLHIGVPAANGSAMSPAYQPGDPGYGTYFFSEFFGGIPVAPMSTNQWTETTHYPYGAIIEDNDNPPNIQIVTVSGTTGATEPTSTSTPPWNTALNGTTQDGSVTWTNLGPALAQVPGGNTQANAVALDPLGDIFVAGGTDTANIGDNVGFIGPFANSGTGAWILKVKGASGAWVYGVALENNPTVSAIADTANGIAVDAAGNAYVVGTSTGTLLTTLGSYQPTNAGGEDAFMVSISPSGLGTGPNYGTYLGGSGNDQGLAVAVDNSGATYVTGSTQSANFPLINPLVDPTSGDSPILALNGTQDAFVAKFSAVSDGSAALLFSAYLGGSGVDQGNAIAVDAGSDMYVGGSTTSDDVEGDLAPSTYTAPQVNYGGNGDGFVAMIAGDSLPTVAVSPGSLNFGTQDVGSATSSAAQVTYTNKSSVSSVSISSVAFGGYNPADFTQVYPGTTTNCVAGVVAAGSACSVWVVFTPGATGYRSATLIITDDASSAPHVISLSGNGAIPETAFTPTSLTFGSQAVGSSSASQPITLENTGDGILDLSSIAISGTNSSDFTESNNCPAQLATGSTCTITVVFSPTSSGARNAAIVVNDNVPGSPQSLALSGSATGGSSGTGSGGSGSVSLSPTSLSFTTGQTQSVTLINGTSTAVTLSNMQITGDTSEFTLSSGSGTTCSTSANVSANGGTCAIAVIYNASSTATSTQTATLSVTSSASSTPLQVSLSGAATSNGSGSGGGSSSTNFTLTPANGGGESVTQGSTVNFPVAVATSSTTSETISFACSGSGSINGSTVSVACSLSPNQVTVSSTAGSAVTVTVNTAASSSRLARPSLRSRFIFLAVLPFSFFGMLLIRKRRGTWLGLTLLALCLLMGLASCSSGSSSSSNGSALPAGTYTLNLTGTANTQPAQTSSATLTLVVNAQ